VLPGRVPRRPAGGPAHGAGRRRHVAVHRRHRLHEGAPAVHHLASAKHALRALAFGLAREFGPQGLHVAHVLVDGGIAGERLLSAAPGLAERAGADGLLDPDAIAGAYWHLCTQPRSAWTLELDLRPYKESF
jgi:NAD(P)-dependent dehydrogenase (short-subunit alcohol dehydrogenase family)